MRSCHIRRDAQFISLTVICKYMQSRAVGYGFDASFISAGRGRLRRYRCGNSPAIAAIISLFMEFSSVLLLLASLMFPRRRRRLRRSPAGPATDLPRWRDARARRGADSRAGHRTLLLWSHGRAADHACRDSDSTNCCKLFHIRSLLVGFLKPGTTISNQIVSMTGRSADQGGLRTNGRALRARCRGSDLSNP